MESSTAAMSDPTLLSDAALAAMSDAEFEEMLKRRVFVHLPTMEQTEEEKREAEAAARRARRRMNQWKPEGPFRFFDLPSELRIKILDIALVLPRTIDVTVDNARRVAPRLQVMRVSRQMHEEAKHVFYGHNTFRIFVTEPTSFMTKKVLLQRLSPRYRSALTMLELRLGPGWSKPPKTWLISPKLGLADCTSVRKLKIFVQLDPSHDMFKGFRMDDSSDAYTDFTGALTRRILSDVPTITEVEFDAYDSVTKTCPLMVRLLGEVSAAQKRVLWGKEKDWDYVEPEPMDMISLQKALNEIFVRA